MEQEIMEFNIANEVSTMIAQGIKKGITPNEVVEIYFAAIGASLSVLYPNSTSRIVYKMAGSHTRAGFLEANAMDLDPGRGWKP